MYRDATADGIAGGSPGIGSPPIVLIADRVPAERPSADTPSLRPLIVAPSASASNAQLLVGAGAALLAGMVNAIAGGGTLLTFPALVAAGLSPLSANATSTVALLPGALSSMLGYRGELAGVRRWAILFALPSLFGGALGAMLLLRTSSAAFDRIVPWLVLGATALFLAQRPLLRLVRGSRQQPGDDALSARRPSAALLAGQFVVGIYGGYFGAGIGILMLAALGLMGFVNIHRMNGLKNWGGFCMNLVAAVTFASSGIVRWPVALGMAIGSIVGGYVGARAALRVSQEAVRGAVAAVGLLSGLWLLLRL
ncbi:MAG TPA: TSUP family transporter [Gemmatimonadaceae bacterium]|nr:TSUP family transporter [Gemmatimonadaceae bacterium]